MPVRVPAMSSAVGGRESTHCVYVALFPTRPATRLAGGQIGKSGGQIGGLLCGGGGVPSLVRIIA